ncbi:uncharacterized protein [Centruroides vittatus]
MLQLEIGEGRPNEGCEKTDLDVTPGFYRLADVAAHCQPDDCWVIVGHKVYDVTSFLSEHPGGYEIIMEHAGRDATIAFYGAAHLKEAFRQLDRLLVGVLVEYERLNLFDEDPMEMVSAR